jgi:hypothetical protein
MRKPLGLIIASAEPREKHEISAPLRPLLQWTFQPHFTEF